MASDVKSEQIKSPHATRPVMRWGRGGLVRSIEVGWPDMAPL